MPAATIEPILYSLALSNAPAIGPARFKQLLDRFETAENVFSAPASEISETLGDFRPTEQLFRYLRRPVTADDFSAELEFVALDQQFLLAYGDADYPPLLKELFDPPPLLYIKGAPGILNEPQLAIVGSRNASARGLRRSTEFSAALATLGITITSGLAMGIDQAAHRGARTADGLTIAVLGNGLDSVYPRQNRRLAADILENGGALVSEQPLSAAPVAANFPKRNRIISGLSLGTLVVEATLHSGSLITARMASEQGREVFALPGDIDSPHSKGCHRLIRDGAQLTETVDDILGAIAPQLARFVTPTAAMQPFPLSDQQRQIIDSIGYASTTIDEITVETGLTAAEVSSMLLSLELNGLIAPLPGGRYSRT